MTRKTETKKEKTNINITAKMTPCENLGEFDNVTITAVCKSVNVDNDKILSAIKKIEKIIEKEFK